MEIERNLHQMEQSRETQWAGLGESLHVRLSRQALTVRHCLHILPGEQILELGAGSGLWTEQLSRVLKDENPITAAVFDDKLAAEASARPSLKAKIIRVNDLSNDLGHQFFDYIIGSSILSHKLYPQTLASLRDLLKPGGQMLFFEPGFWNPNILLKNFFRLAGFSMSEAKCYTGINSYQLMKMASHQDFTKIEIIPFSSLHDGWPKSILPLVRTLRFTHERAPVIRNLCSDIYICLTKPGEEPNNKNYVNLAEHSNLFDSTSVVVPCHNEAMNIPALVSALIKSYGDYLREIIIVNDNSTDQTAEITRQIAEIEPRVKLINRHPPNGVGRALRDGYAAATGKYILTMDCDFVQVVPELRDLFDCIAKGHDGAIGSRFSLESVLINYPFLKAVCNRACHLLIRLLLPVSARDVSNNLKLYRAEILKGLDIEENHFAANLETGLKPLLSGYDIREVPISWINRSPEMGHSSFKLAAVAPRYWSMLLKTAMEFHRGKRNFVRDISKGTTKQSSL